MKLSLTNSNRKEFADVRVGECFRAMMDDEVYMRVNCEEYNAVRLADGEVTSFYKNSMVSPISLKAVEEA